MYRALKPVTCCIVLLLLVTCLLAGCTPQPEPDKPTAGIVTGQFDEEETTTDEDQTPAWTMVERETTEQESTEKEEPVPEPESLRFVVFGLSGNYADDSGRSDTIMVCDVNHDTKEIKLVSILRDTKAKIEGHEPQKLNAAYKYGGPDLALDAIKQNFGIDIKDYITFNFDTFIEIVDLMGGIQVILTQQEADTINAECFGNLVEGSCTLNGYEALTYSRIRKIDSDTYRAGRQQAVIDAILVKMGRLSPIQYLEGALSIIRNTETSIPLDQIAALLQASYKGYTVSHYVVPDIEEEPNLRTAIDEHGEWVWLYDTQKAGERIMEILDENFSSNFMSQELEAEQTASEFFFH